LRKPRPRTSIVSSFGAAPQRAVVPRESGGPSTPRRFGPITAVSAYWVARSSRAMTVCGASAVHAVQRLQISRTQHTFALAGRVCPELRRSGFCAGRRAIVSAWANVPGNKEAGGLRSRPRKLSAAMVSGVRGLRRERGIGAARRAIGTGDSAVRRSAARQFQAKPARGRELASQHIPIRIARLKV
jgi:hypothetical protein